MNNLSKSKDEKKLNLFWVIQRISYTNICSACMYCNCSCYHPDWNNIF